MPPPLPVLPLSSRFSFSLCTQNQPPPPSLPFLSLPSTSLLSNLLFTTTTTTKKNLIKPAMSFSSSSSLSPSMNKQSDFDPPEDDQNLLHALKYHNQTKHSFHKYARGPHGLDWTNQPNPFRRYVSSPLLPLDHFPSPPPSSSDDTSLPYSSLFHTLPPPKPISKSTISQLFYNSLALSAWKTTGFSTWSLRVNPSSGNLHPTEAYLISPPIDSVSDYPFVAHYAPKEHSLELRAEIRSNFFPKFFPENSFLIGFSSIFWREAWKYGERAFRYCNHDVGHAIAAVSIAAAELGWDVKLLEGLGHDDLKILMGLYKFPEFEITSRPVKGTFPLIEFEHPDCVLAVFPNGIDQFSLNYAELSSVIKSEFSKLEWKGNRNLLSKEHVCWDIIYRTSEAVKKPLTISNKPLIDPFSSSGICSEDSYKDFTVREVVRKRRSAVDMDAVTTMERETFYQILLHCLPSGTFQDREKKERQGKQLALPFRVLPWESEVHAALFVHRVVGVPKGLYFLVRNEDHLEELKRCTSVDFKWAQPEGCPGNLPLYELHRGDYRTLANKLSCHQDIAGDGCFSLGMVARFEPSLREKGAYMYPRLFWETGVLGQVLYLEAHAVGVSATGIGCYFDDHVHETLGIKGSHFQSLYHFTVGGPVLDKRIMSLPAYPGPAVDA